MLQRFKFIGISHHHSPVEIRGMFSFNDYECESLMNELHRVLDLADLMVLSTCNRTEIYYSANNDFGDEIIKLAALQKGITDLRPYKKYFVGSADHTEAQQHLFRVSLGLEAQVIGDLQIINQVKKAYQRSADAGVAGPFLHRLMHTVFYANKRAERETAFRDGAASMSYATVVRAEELAESIQNPRTLIMGLGEIGTEICKHLIGSSFDQITLYNRTESKAVAAAEEYGFEPVKTADISKAIAAADIVISTVTGEIPLITSELILPHSTHSIKYFIDLAVPRSIDKDVEQIPGMIVYNIDDIREKTTEALAKRKQAVPKVEQIIEELSGELGEWTEEMRFSPSINRFKSTLNEIRKEELARHIGKLNEDQSQAVEAITDNIIQKIIKLPVLKLKAACKRGEGESLVEGLNELFDLEKEKPEKSVG